MKEHPELFRTLKTKAIAQVRVTTADVEEVKDWFYGFHTWCKERDIQPRDVLNFDEARFQVGVTLSEEIVVLAYVKEVSTLLKSC
jgi:hypothetical protein